MTWTPWTRRFIPAQHQALAARVPIRDVGHGFDLFGMSRDGIAAALMVAEPLYRRWFRVISHGAHHIPGTGAAVLAANHSGTLPYDAMMIWRDVIEQTAPPRVPRAVVDHFVGLLPGVSLLFTRGGAIGGSRQNFLRILELGELLLVFPEGSPGIGKRFVDRYQLADWRVGHAELAIRSGVPVVPVAVVGAEEQMPIIHRFDNFHLLGAPYLPIPATLVPLPVRYHIHYGEPIHLEQDYRPEDSDDPVAVREASARVADAVQGLIDRGLAQREGVFQ